MPKLIEEDSFSGLAARLNGRVPRKRTEPLWTGPSGIGPLGGITYSMLNRFLTCRERFRLYAIDGLKAREKFDHKIVYGNMWHLCEEDLAANKDWNPRLLNYAKEMLDENPLDQEYVVKWYNTCTTQFLVYVDYWSKHPEVVQRRPMLQEQVFDIQYPLPSGRVIRLRGKFDSVDWFDQLLFEEWTFPPGLWVQENKTKGTVDRVQLVRQLTFDLQTMIYVTALQRLQEIDPLGNYPIQGVRYNVIRRPFAGGKGNIKQSEGTEGSKCQACDGAGERTLYAGTSRERYENPCSKCGGKRRTGAKPAETDEEFYGRLRDEYIAKDPQEWFFRWTVPVTQDDIRRFRTECLDPMLEAVCWWYDWQSQLMKGTQITWRYNPPSFHWRHPFGCYNTLNEGYESEFDAYFATGSTVGLKKIDTLFRELQEPTKV